MYQFAREPLSPAYEEAGDLLRAHWEELAAFKDIPLDPDIDAYRAMEKADMLRVFTVRCEGKLIGYAVYMVRKNPHYKSTKMACSDIVLVEKAHRSMGLGNGLFDFVEASLKAEGVVVIETRSKADHPVLGMLLESRGHVLIDVSHQKRL